MDTEVFCMNRDPRGDLEEAKRHHGPGVPQRAARTTVLR